MSSLVHMLKIQGKPAGRRQSEIPLNMTVDKVLLLSTILLLSIGMVMVTSASISVADKQLGDPFYFARKHMIYITIGLGLLFLMQRIRLVYWEKSGAALVFFSFFLLVLVLIPGLGNTVKGATRWLDLGFIGLQVSEPVRLFLLIYLSGYLLRHGEEVRTTLSGFLKPMVLLAAASLLILIQPDFGSCVVLLLTALGVMFLAGVRLWQFALLLTGFLAVFAVLAISSPYRLARLTAFLDPWADPFNTGFQLTQSLIAFGSGGWFGVGLGSSVQKLFYLPEAHNDFLFAILAEELGLLGVVVVLVLFALIVYRAFRIGAAAELHKHFFAAYLSYGLGLWFAIQAMVNIGVNAGLLPTKGLTLPLVSAGGSSLLVMCAAVGLLLRINNEVETATAQAMRKQSRQPSGKPSKRNKVLGNTEGEL